MTNSKLPENLNRIPCLELKKIVPNEPPTLAACIKMRN